MITKADILMGRDKEYPLTPQLEVNLSILVQKINILEASCPFKFKLTSGYRPGRFNTAAKGAKNSAHLTCEAVDVADAKGILKEYLVKNIEILNKLGLYMEDPAKTKTWVHLQTRKTKNNPFKV